MWDVVWTDPNRESVGERRARKEAERERQERDKKAGPRGPSSTRSSSSADHKPFGFPRRGLKRTISSPKASKPSSTPNSEPKSHRGSLLGGKSIGSGDGDTSTDTTPQSAQAAPSVGPIPETELLGGDTSPISLREFLDSVFSRCTEPASTYGGSIAESTKSEVVQALGGSSFITKSTEVMVVPRTRENGLDHVVTEVTISSEGQRDKPPTPPLSPMDDISMSSPGPDTGMNPNPAPRRPARSADDAAWVGTFKPNNPDCWKPPQAWGSGHGPADVQAHTIRDFDGPSARTPDLDAYRRLEELQQELRRMAGASPEDIMQRLHEIWSTPPTDPVSFRRLDREQKHWMLSTLAHLDPVVEQDPANPPTRKVVLAKAQKVLALYESQAVALYLAGLHYNKDVYHLSTSPLAAEIFPNVHPLLAPAVSPSSWPVARQLFGTAYSLALPALCSSSDIPNILRNVYRALAPGGVFQITLVDPMPCPTTLGPRMRAWLEDNLLINLERQFRCVNPSKLFPIWLGDARLRGEGSTITTAQFAAVSSSYGSDTGREDDPAYARKAARGELRAIVGRMLWAEVWGRYVEATQWWWDDAECVEECQAMNTKWEYSLIEAVKEEPLFF